MTYGGTVVIRLKQAGLAQDTQVLGDGRLGMGAVFGHMKDNLVDDAAGVAQDVAEDLHTHRMA